LKKQRPSVQAVLALTFNVERRIEKFSDSPRLSRPDAQSLASFWAAAACCCL